MIHFRKPKTLLLQALIFCLAAACPDCYVPAFETLHSVWDSQNAGSLLKTSVYDAPHEFNREMQRESLDFFDTNL